MPLTKHRRNVDTLTPKRRGKSVAKARDTHGKENCGNVKGTNPNPL